MGNPKVFMNDAFEVLEFLYKRMDSDGISRTTQQEVAEKLNKSRTTINGIFTLLREEGYLLKVDKKECCYVLSESAKRIARFMLKEYGRRNK